MALTSADLIAAPPHLHGFDPSGKPQAWGLDSEVLRIIDGLLRPGWRTLETGAGVSTVLFALRSTHHICVAPDSEETERIRAYCAEQEISTDRLTFVLEPSETALPQLDVTDLDLVLIDGSHAFPTVFIDWYYTADRLRTGGWLVVDDTNLWTGRVLRDFLAAEDAWELSTEVPMRTAIFRKIAATNGASHWIYQPYVVAHSRPAYLSPLRKALLLLRERKFHALLHKVRRRLSRDR